MTYQTPVSGAGTGWRKKGSEFIRVVLVLKTDPLCTLR